MNRWRFINTK